MSKYLKLFETTSQYNEYINGSDVVLPNVSVAKDAPKMVYFNPIRPFFAKLSLNNGEVVELQGSGELTYEMVSPYTSSVVSAEIGELCTSIGYQAFQNCTVLTSIVIDSANTVFDSRDNCNAIINTSTNELIVGCKNTVIPNTVTSIGQDAFVGCSGLTSITIPNSVTSIGDGAFIHCYGLTSITIPDSVTSIGGWAFFQCDGLTSVTIGSSVTSIGEYAFYVCSSLTNITSLATTAPTIQSDTFWDVKTNGTLTVPVGSTGYDVWMGTGNYYLGKYNWTKVEQ